MSLPNLPPPLPATGPAVPKRVDFADWLSPILVKELRQGLRTRVFTATFLILQLVLTGVVFIGLVVAANGGNTGANSGFFWTFVGLPLTLILPWSGLNAVNVEARQNTLDLIFLTRLSAWRIVLGKWIAIVAQAALLVAAVLPYVVLRYFMGGVDLAGELKTLGTLFLISAALAAVFVGLSAYPGKLIRGLVVVGLLLGLQVGLPMMAMLVLGPMMGAPSSIGPSPHPLVVAGGWAFLFLAALLGLEFGAARIAPSAENHAARKRVIVLAGLLLALVIGRLAPNAEVLYAAAFALALPVLIGGLCDQTQPVPRVCRPFARRGFPGRLLGRFLYPGWASGFLFALVVLAVAAALFAQAGLFSKWWGPLTFGALCGSLLTPVAILRIVAPASRRFLALYVGIVAVTAMLSLIVRIVDGATNGHAIHWLAFWPLSALLAIGSGGIETADVILPTAMVWATTVLSLLVLVLAAWRNFRGVAAAERTSVTPAAITA